MLILSIAVIERPGMTDCPILAGSVNTVSTATKDKGRTRDVTLTRKLLVLIFLDKTTVKAVTVCFLSWTHTHDVGFCIYVDTGQMVPGML